MFCDKQIINQNGKVRGGTVEEGDSISIHYLPRLTKRLCEAGEHIKAIKA